jgi:hypothetical protein
VTADGPSRHKLDELLADLQVERAKLDRLVESLCELERTIDREPPLPVWVDAGALRLQSFYTGIERCFVLIVRVLNGGSPDGADWHRRLLERMAIATDVRPAVLRADTARSLGELLRFRHVVRHLYAYDLDAEQVERLLGLLQTLWPEVTLDLNSFSVWLEELRATG